MTIDPAWAGTVQFYELVFGTWLAYGFLILVWEKLLGEPLPEWQYVLITFLGASVFGINHYLQHAPFYWYVLNAYSIAFLIIYWLVCVHPPARSAVWKTGALATAVVFTIAFIGFEMIARYAVNSAGVAEFWVMLAAFAGTLGLIAWRARAGTR